MKRTKTLYRTLAITTTACLLCLTFALADHKPNHNPGGGGGGGGSDEPTEVIYFTHDSDTWQMADDGSGKTPLNLGYYGSNFVPSHKQHGVGRLFLREGVNRSMTVTKENGSTVVLLADGEDGDWEVNHNGGFRWVTAGGNQDAKVSWSAIRTDGTNLEYSVARASVMYDTTTGDVTGLDLGSIEHYSGISDRYDWSPDGTMIVFNDLGVLWIFDTVSQGEISLPVEQVWESPAWSPDGLQIAYTIIDREADTTRVEVIDLLDDSVTLLAAGRTQSSTDGTVVRMPHWSPSSSSLLYRKGNWNGFSHTTAIIQTNANGKGKQKNLISDLTGTSHGVWICGWRSK